MRRRSALTGALAFFAVVPLSGTALAQSAKSLPRIGILSGRDTPIEAGWRVGMRELGYVEGRNVAYVVRNAHGASERLRAFAAELVALKVDVIFAMSSPAIVAAREATSAIPIVFTIQTDPVAKGWVRNYARPGGNLSGLVGLSQDLAVKRLELALDDIVGERAARHLARRREGRVVGRAADVGPVVDLRLLDPLATAGAGDEAGVDQILGPVQLGQLRGSSPAPDLGAEVDLEHQRRLARRRVGRGAQDRADPDVDPGEVVIADQRLSASS